MDREADSLDDGEPTGLQEYALHSSPHQPGNIRAWTHRLARALKAEGYEVAVHKRYPRSNGAERRQFCDLVLTTSPTERLWLEVRGAWKSAWGHGREPKPRSPFWSYLFGPLDRTVRARGHSAGQDLAKLLRLQANHGSHRGLLVVGFDNSKTAIDQDVARLERLSGLGAARSDWRRTTDEWNDTRRPGEWIKVWLWTSAIDAPPSSPRRSG